MKEKILQIVERVSQTHERGEEFFSEIDRILAFEVGEELFKELRAMVPKDYGIVLSGKFGKQFASAIGANKIEDCSYLLVEGGIRSGAPVKLIGSYGHRRGTYVFIDDSIFSGTTYLVIKSWMRTFHNINVERCIAAYDGWPSKRRDVDSLFRYYDEILNVPVHEKF